MHQNRIQVLHSVSREGGACLRSFFRTELDVHKKGNLDLVTLADITCEQTVVKAIATAFPDDAIVAEEGHGRDGQSGYSWIIDPLDGTTNFAHGHAQFCISVALAHQGQVIGGVVFDPIKDEFFEATLGGGARLNGNPIRVAARGELNDALCVTGYSYDRRERIDVLLERTRRILMNCRGILRLGSAALDLAYVASGRIDVYVEDGLHAWDIAAGQLLVREAGGVVSNFQGGPLDVFRGEILATQSGLQAEALAKLLG